MSGNICDEYAKLDSRVVVVHQKNKGTGPTRVYGVEMAKGDYVAFVDNDDYISPNMYSIMMSAIEYNEVDVCVCQWNYVQNDGKLVFDDSNRNPIMLGIHDSFEWEAFLYHGFLPGSTNAWYHNGMVCLVWNKLYRRDLILGYTASRDRAEDDEMNDWVNHKKCRLVVISDELYYWCDNQHSVSHQAFAKRNLYTLNVLYERINRFAENEFIVKNTLILYLNIYIEYYYRAKHAGFSMPLRYSTYFIDVYVRLLLRFEMPLKLFVRVNIFLLSKNLYKKFINIRNVC